MLKIRSIINTLEFQLREGGGNCFYQAQFIKNKNICQKYQSRPKCRHTCVLGPV